MLELAQPAREVLDFWFGPMDGSEDVDEAHRRRWFVKDPRFDREIDERFGHLLNPARDGLLDWQQSPHGRLALILLLDQFPRNIFRGTPTAFAYDPAALALCLGGLARLDDQRCGLFERAFCYLPLEHAEDLAHQQHSVRLFKALLNEAPESRQTTFASFYDYAVRHRDIIARFGRFPHRNAILGRATTAEEREFLKHPDSSF